MTPGTSVAAGDELTETRFAEALLNILEDAQGEREQLQATQRAVLNILEDSGAAAEESADASQATLNLLEDFCLERDALASTQSAMVNILDDFDLERIKTHSAIRDLAREMGERELAERSLEEAKARTDATNDELEQVNKQLETFSFSVAHDLRGPLRAINGFSRILLEDHADSLNAEGQRVLGVVVRNVEKMGILIDGLLSFSRLGRAALAPELVDMTTVVHGATEDLRAAGVLSSTEIVVQPLEPAMADPTLIAQVWANLLSNAVKFQPEGHEGRVMVSSVSHEGEIAYSVADNGAGFDMKYADKLFGVFQRLHSSDEFEGTGIGLATVARIIERHGGRVWADGAVGEGATFTFTLPSGEGQS